LLTSRLTGVTPLRRTLVPLILVLSLFSVAAPASAAELQATHIVQLRPGVTLDQGRALVRAAGGRPTGTLPLIRSVAARLPAGARVAVAHDARVASVSANARIRSQHEIIDTPSLASGAYPRTVSAPTAWKAWATGTGVGVAVIDTGVDGRLPDFNEADGSSRVIASAVTNPDATTALDTYGHGTHVAGIIAGNGNRRTSDTGHTYIGIAPEANLIAIKASDDAGNATILDAIYGLQFAVDHKDDYNIRVVNLSLSSTEAESYRTDPLDAAVEAAHFSGIVVVAAAGNRGGAAGAAGYAPGNDPFAISVGAIDDRATSSRFDDLPTGWSTLGTTQDGFAKPEIAAPGAHIVSTLAGGSAFSSACPACVVDNNYIRLGGTSMAAGVVSGVAALMLEIHPDWTPDEVKSTMLATARGIPGDVEEVNAASAVFASTPAPVPNEQPVPNDLVDGTTGEIDYTRSSWGRSSWGSAPDVLVAGWARSSWGCECSGGDGADAENTRSSWGAFTWASRWDY
jgi:serine protease AprX